MIISYPIPDFAFFVFNIIIVSGYLAAAITLALSKRVLPFLDASVSTTTRILGVNFFVIAALSRLQLAYHTVEQKPFLHLASGENVSFVANFISGYQSISVWAFFIFLGRDLAVRGIRSDDH